MGYGSSPVGEESMSPDTKKMVKTRLARVEGQVRGLSQMVEQDRYCIDVITQVRAARAALAKVEQVILSDHLGSCVESAIASGDPKLQRAKVAELIDVLARSNH
jgi:CsoR family transcriptional regulator, copper-sensing transcriptional repressor